ncbi:MAG: hypothetical protein M3R29_07215 [Verrucomicrobiota bacterium]|nr:hypothetical protein [Verrucomicrobiota bacterium]
MSETSGRANFQIVQDNHAPDWRIPEREKKSVLTLCRVGRAIDENEPGLLETVENFRPRFKIKRLDQSKPVPAALERDDGRKIASAFCDRSVGILGLVQPFRRVFDAGGASRRSAEHMR